MSGLSSTRRPVVQRATEQSSVLKSTAASLGSTATPSASSRLQPALTVWVKTPRRSVSVDSPRLSRRQLWGPPSPRASTPQESHRGGGAERHVNVREPCGTGRTLSISSSSTTGSGPATAGHPGRGARPERPENSTGANFMNLGTHTPPRTRSLDPNLPPSLMACSAPLSDALRIPRRRACTPRPVSARARLSAWRPSSSSSGDAPHDKHITPRSPRRHPSEGSDNTCGAADATAAPEAKDAATAAAPPAAPDRPWLAAPPARGILKHRVAAVTSGRTSSVAPTSLSSTPTVKGPGPAGVRTPEPSAHVAAERPARHVTFDEAATEYLSAMGSHVVYDDSRLGMQPDAMEWGTVRFQSMPFPEARRGAGLISRRRCTPMGAMAKANLDCWGADSEWFKTEFVSQLTPTPSRSTSLVDGVGGSTDGVPAALYTDHAASSASVSLSPKLGANGQLRASLSSVSTSNSSHRGSPRHLVIGAVQSKNEEATDDGAASESTEDRHGNLGSTVSAARSRTPMSTRVAGAGYAGTTLRTRVPPTATTLPTTTATATPATSISAAEVSTSGDANDSSPVLAYDDAPSRTTAPRDVEHHGVWRSLGAPSPPPPLTVSDLRRVSPPVSPAAFPSAAGGPGGGGSKRSEGGGPQPQPQPRITSRSVSLASVESSLAAEGCSSGVDRADSPAVQSAAREALRCMVVADSPPFEFGAVPRATSDERLLHAVSHVRTRSHLAGVSPRSSRTDTAANSLTMTTAASASVSASSSTTGPRRSSTTVLGDPCANVLSAGIRQFLNGGSLTPSSVQARRSHRGSCSSASAADSGSVQVAAALPSTSPLHGDGDGRVSGANAATSSAVLRSRDPRRSPPPSSAGRRSSVAAAPLLPSSPAAVVLVPTPSSPFALDSGADTTAPPSAISTLSSTRRPSNANAHPHSLRLRGSIASSPGCSAIDDDDVDDESEPHIHVPVPTPRASTTSSRSAAVLAGRRLSDEVR